MVAAGISVFGLSWLLSVCATRFVRDIANRFSAFDRIDSSRKIHARPVPRIGGIAFVAAIYSSVGLSLAVPSLWKAFVADGSRLLALASGGLAVAGLGVWDDLRGTGARQKLAVQLSVALLLYCSGYALHSVENPFGPAIELGALSAPVTLLWIVGVSNAMNLIDGLDGLAGGIALAATAVILAMAVQAEHLPRVLIAAAMAGSILGFLVYNVSPASIFMGDTGSLFLGTVLAALALTPKGPGGEVPLVAMALAMGVPIADTLLAIFRRAARGAPMFSADREHIHHRILDLGFDHARAARLLWIVAAILACAAIHVACGSRGRSLVTLIAIAGMGLVVESLGMIRAPVSDFVERRRRNRERRMAIRAACVRIREARRVAEIRQALGIVAPAIEAQSVSLRLGVDAAPVASVEPGTVRSFPLEQRGLLDVWWTDERTVDRDIEVAIEIVCRHLIKAIPRVHREWTSHQC